MLLRLQQKHLKLLGRWFTCFPFSLSRNQYCLLHAVLWVLLNINRSATTRSLPLARITATHKPRPWFSMLDLQVILMLSRLHGKRDFHPSHWKPAYFTSPRPPPSHILTWFSQGYMCGRNFKSIYKEKFD